jgi:hypothetical protein
MVTPRSLKCLLAAALLEQGLRPSRSEEPDAEDGL